MKPQTHQTLCGQKYYINPLPVASLLAAVLTFMCFVIVANHFIPISYLNKTANNFSIYTIHHVRCCLKCIMQINSEKGFHSSALPAYMLDIAM